MATVPVRRFDRLSSGQLPSVVSGPELEFRRTIARELVHKSAVSEVFLTDWMPEGGEIWVAVQWPRRHWFFGEPGTEFNPIIALETFRQAAVLISHMNYAVPIGWRAIIDRTHVQLSPLSQRPGGHPIALWLRVAVDGIARTDGYISSLKLSAQILEAEAVVGRGSMSIRLLPEAAYQRVAVPLTGADRPPLPGPENGHPIVVDRDHPVFFDRASRYIPEMLLISEAAGVGRAILDRPLRAVSARFPRPFEVAEPVWLTSHRATRFEEVVVQFHHRWERHAEVQVN